MFLPSLAADLFPLLLHCWGCPRPLAVFPDWSVTLSTEH